MKIIIATPLYPPETEELGRYSKEVADRLALGGNSVLVVSYGKPGVAASKFDTVFVSKKHYFFVRILKYILLLWKETRGAEVIYSQNAVACGLPAVIIGSLRNIPVIIHFAEDEAWKNAVRLHLTKDTPEKYLAGKSYPLKIKTFIAIQRMVLCAAKKVVITAPIMSQLLEEIYGVQKGKIIQNPYPEKRNILPSALDRLKLPKEFAALFLENENDEKARTEHVWASHIQTLIELFKNEHSN